MARANQNKSISMPKPPGDSEGGFVVSPSDSAPDGGTPPPPPSGGGNPPQKDRPTKVDLTDGLPYRQETPNERTQRIIEEGARGGQRDGRKGGRGGED
jgi:hypothetical protein